MTYTFGQLTEVTSSAATSATVGSSTRRSSHDCAIYIFVLIVRMKESLKQVNYNCLAVDSRGEFKTILLHPASGSIYRASIAMSGLPPTCQPPRRSAGVQLPPRRDAFICKHRRLCFRADGPSLSVLVSRSTRSAYGVQTSLSVVGRYLGVVPMYRLNVEGKTATYTVRRHSFLSSPP